MTITEIQNNAKTKMEKTKDVLRSDLMAIRAGRANPQLLDRITVDYYGTPTPLKNVANISAPEPRVLQINPWDAKMVKDISKAIQASDLGAYAVQRWQGDPPAAAGVDRGAPQGADQARAQDL